MNDPGWEAKMENEVQAQIKKPAPAQAGE
jgi:hypothetical protein